MIKTLERILDGLPDQQLRLIKPVNSREIAEGAFGALLPSDPTVNDDVANTAGNGYFGSRSWWQNSITNDVWYCQTGVPVGAAAWVKIYPVTVPAGTIVLAGANVDVTEAPAGTYTVSISSIPESIVTSGYPATEVGAGALPAGVTLAAPQVSAGALPAGVTLAAPQVSAGALPAGVTLAAPQVSAGALPAGVTIPGTQLTAGALPAGVTIPGTQLTAGALPAGVTIPGTQLTAGALPAGVTIDYSQLTGSAPPAALTVNGAVAAAGFNQAGATLLTENFNQVTTATVVTQVGVILNNAINFCGIVNKSGITINVYPPVGAQINSSFGVNVRFPLSDGFTMLVVRLTSTYWVLIAQQSGPV